MQAVVGDDTRPTWHIETPAQRELLQQRSESIAKQKSLIRRVSLLCGAVKAPECAFNCVYLGIAWAAVPAFLRSPNDD